MSRSGYNEDGWNYSQWNMICWRGRVASATRGRRGQKLLRDLLAALDAMPEKRLISGEFECADGVCALGAIGKARGIDMSKLDPYDDSAAEYMAHKLDIAAPLAQEIVFENDEGVYGVEEPVRRWHRMRYWVASQIVEEDQS